MSACFALLSLVHPTLMGQIKVQKGPIRGKVPVGADAAAIGKIRAGHYVANRDPSSLPKASELGDKVQVFTGNVYVLGDKSPQIVPFVGGRRRIFDKGTVTAGESLKDFLRSQDSKAVVTAAEATYAHFEVVLPGDAKKLAGFDGTITFFVKDMKPEQALTVIMKKGKAVRSY